ncbi:hypothetical protein [Insolitispirillum peregrinum]|uniref:Uncharacterized protein n=1 Tax=Insolitispirillum peregrinum TaxID=80876 RepID=A0A1N7QB79_9PROT|nr:hypothetical protein [Insolitispirillum peregrinum]SIT19989.1 hypothetical protein SAMN05421779_11344 [Insolitispirillum peregrinum]
MTKMQHSAQGFSGTQTMQADCVALARQARAHATAFRSSVQAFDNINISGIFGELRAMRQAVTYTS